jgi:protoheme IX farnesyltransferase
LPFWLHMDSKIYAIAAVVLGLVYLGYTIRFGRIVRARNQTESRMYARDLLKVSVIYLPLLLTALMLCAK